MQIVTIEDLKAQLRVDFEEDDSLITVYGEAAEDAILNYTRRTYEELCNENYTRNGNNQFPRMIYVAILMLAAQLYRAREPVSGLNQVLVPYTLEYMIKPWIKLV